MRCSVAQPSLNKTGSSILHPKQGRQNELFCANRIARALSELRHNSALKAGHSCAYANLLQDIKVLTEGKFLHARIAKTRRELDLVLGNALITMYANCRSLEDARQVFYGMPERNASTWNTMIAAYAKHREAKHVFRLIEEMGGEGFQPDKSTLVSAFKACATLGKLGQGKQIHAYMVATRIYPTIFILNTLVDMYTKCGSLQDARRVFHSMHKRDLVTWNVMIVGHAKHGYTEAALELFQQLEWEGLKPDELSFLGILDACAGIGNIEHGKKIHAHAVVYGIEPSMVMGNALINMYAKCENLNDACEVFHKMPQHDIVSWNTILAGHAKYGHANKVFQLFLQMGSLGPDEVTFLSILSACASLGDLEKGKQIHNCIIKVGIRLNRVMENALLDMYVKCGGIEFAFHLFNKMINRSVVSWTVMIIAFTKLGNTDDALKLFQQMQCEGFEPNEVTILSLLSACTSLGDLDKGKQVDAYITGSALYFDVDVVNAVVDMYAKCGSIIDARRRFDNMHTRDIVSWNVIVTGYAQHGYGKEALQLVDQMIKEGIKANSITFISVLSACSHAGLLREGCYYFDCMIGDHGIIPVAEHYACMVDLLGRAGHLEEADDFIRSIPSQPSLAVWKALGGACKIHDDVKLVKQAAESVLQVEPNNPAVFVLLSNISAVSACQRKD